MRLLLIWWWLLLAVSGPPYTLILTLSPPGPARVYMLEGETLRELRSVGTGYACDVALTPGPKVLIIKRPGYREARTRVDLGPPGSYRVRDLVRLEPLIAHLTVHSEPDGVEVYQGKDFLGITGQPLSLNLGSVFDSGGTLKLTLRRPNYRNQTLELGPASLPAADGVSLDLIYPSEGAVVMVAESGPAWLAIQLREHTLRSLLVVLAAVVPLGLAAAMWRRQGREAARRARLEGVRAVGEDLGHDTLLNRQLGGYLLVERLGTGGMASVYRGIPADSLDESRAVAIKVMRDELLDDPDSRRRFVREMQVTRDLKHPNLVMLYEFGEQEGLHYLVMELVDGGLLSERIPPEGLPLQAALAYFEPLLAGFSYAHHKGVLHRDIKPRNVLVTADGVPKIMDFGIALRNDLSRVTRTGTSLGTPAYMAPEQITAPGAPPDPRSDQYSLGIMLYELLTGRCPFEADDPMAVLFLHLKSQPPSLRALRPEVPPSLERVVLKMLSKELSGRFADLSQVRFALKEALANPQAFSEWELAPRAPAPQPPGAGGDDDSTAEFTL